MIKQPHYAAHIPIKLTEVKFLKSNPFVDLGLRALGTLGIWGSLRFQAKGLRRVMDSGLKALPGPHKYVKSWPQSPLKQYPKGHDFAACWGMWGRGLSTGFRLMLLAKSLGKLADSGRSLGVLLVGLSWMGLPRGLLANDRPFMVPGPQRYVKIWAG